MLLLDKIINYIYPPRCICCVELIQDQKGLCGSCWSKLEFITNPYCEICCFKFDLNIEGGQNVCLKCLHDKPPFDYARSILKFDENSKKIIHNLKYYDNTRIAQDLSFIMVNNYKTLLENADIVVPVPMHKWKRIYRLYNQAQVLAEQIAKLLNKKMVADSLIKIRNTKSQTGLSKKAREKNLIGSFQIQNLSKIKNKKIILVDDVITTGSTIKQCAQKLKNAGAAEVIVLSIAQTHNS